MFHHTFPSGVDYLDPTTDGDFEGFVVGSVLLGFLSHETNVRYRTHRGWVIGSVGAAILNDSLVDPSVGRVRDDSQSIGLATVWAPHLACGADHGWHGGIDDYV